MKKVELLSPAGNMECLKAAIQAGCDAVYLGGKLFGARSFAGNFSDEELIEAIKYAHLYGVKVYLTINTIIYEREVNRFIDYVRFVHKNNIDAVIVQDLGMFDLLRKKFPNLEIHASTQMHIHNLDGALLAKKLGIKRVVMARETPLDVIKKVKEKAGIDVEIFVHGALCLSYSGQCLMSSLIGGRSGNRGTCSQVCRKPYNLYDKNGNKLNKDNYLLSTKDLCTLEYLDSIIKTGVDSLKIEGRMKRKEYVYLVTSIYRKAIDNYYKTGNLKIESADIIELKKIFNREFTKGFMFKEENNQFVNQKRPNHRGIIIGKTKSYNDGLLTIKLSSTVSKGDGLRIIDKEDAGIVLNKMYVNKNVVDKASRGTFLTIPFKKKVGVNKDVVLTTDINQIKMVDKLLETNKRKIKIACDLKAKKDQNLSISITDGINNVSLESSYVVEKAQNRVTTKDIIKKQICKTGNTIYEVDKLNITCDEDIFINIKILNELRRDVLYLLNKKRQYEIPFVEKEYKIDLPNFLKEQKMSILTSNPNNIKGKHDFLYVNDKSLLNDKTILRLPRVVKAYENTNNRVMIGEIGGLNKFTNFDTDVSFNVVNSYAVAFLHSMGAKKVTLSHELTLKQIEMIIDSYHERYNKHPNLETIIEGYEEAMISKFDLNKMYNIKTGYLEDEFKNRYKIESFKDYMIIYNYKKLNKNATEYYNAGVNCVRRNLL